MAGPIRISILANANQALSAFRQTSAEAKTMGSRIGSVSGVLKSALVGVGVYKGVELLTEKFKDANETVQLQQQLAAQTAAAIKSTGGAANVSAAQITAMGEALEGKSLIDAEATRAGENLLLTFTNIRNEAGKGNDIFNQTTQAMADLATAMKTDPTSAAKLLGKALNDPVGGLTALKKAGVSFTDQQKDQIKTLVDSGNTLGAQKIILGELSKEFGGSAAASAKTASGSFFRFKDAIDTVFESITRQVLPVIATVADYLVTEIPRGVAAAQPAIDALRGAFDSVRTAVEPVTTFLKDNPVLLQGAAAALGIAAVAAGGLALAFGAVAVATSPITLTVLAIAGLGAGLAYAYKNSAQFRSIVQQVGQTITTTVVPAIQAAGQYFVGTFIPAVVRVAQTVATNLRPTLTQLGQTFETRIRPAIAQVIAKFIEWRPTIQRIVTTVAQLYARFVVFEAQIAGKVLPVVVRFAGFIIAKVVPATLNFASATARVIGGLISFGQAVVNGAKKVVAFAQTVGQKIAAVVRFFTELPGKIKGAFGNAGSILSSVGSQIIEGLLRPLRAGAAKVEGVLRGITNKIPDWKGPADVDKKLLFGAGQNIMDGLVNGIASREGKLKKKLGEQTKKIKDALSSARSDFASLVEPISSNFTQGLFDFTDAGSFTANLGTAKATLTNLVANFKKLIGEGLSPAFLYQLFSQGGPDLIASLAGLDKASAQATGGLFSDVMSLSDQLGTSVAGATDKGTGLEEQTTRLEAKLDRLTRAVTKSGDDNVKTQQRAAETISQGVVKGVNGAAANGMRRARR